MNHHNHHHRQKKIIQIKLEGLSLTIDRGDVPASNCLNVGITIADGFGEQRTDVKADSNLVSAEIATNHVHFRGDDRSHAKARFEVLRRTVDPSLGSVADIVDVERRSGLCKGYIYRLIKQGEFPTPMKFGRASYWDEAEVDDWIAARVDERLRSSVR